MIRKILTAPARFIAWPFNPTKFDYVLGWLPMVAFLVLVIALSLWS